MRMPRLRKNDLSVRVRERPAGLRLATCQRGYMPVRFVLTDLVEKPWGDTSCVQLKPQRFPESRAARH